MDNQFFFAWVDPNTAFDPVAHAREDAEVVSFDCTHEEATFATLTITIRNPRVGLLAPGRKVWAWLSWRHTPKDAAETITPLFYGRLVGVPDSILGEAVTLTFTGRPSDYNARKTVVADALRVLPFYDPIWIAETERANPDVVLEAYPRVWHVDRIAHTVTTSDIIVGEDGVEDFGGGAGERDEVPYDSVSMKLEQAPLRRIKVDGAVSWGQAGAGTLTLFDGWIASFTGDALISSWPKTGGGIGGGWNVAFAEVRDMDGIGALDDNTWVQGQSNTTKTAEGSAPASPNPFARSDIPPGWLFKKALEWAFLNSYSLEGVLVPRWRVGGTIRAAYQASRSRTEHVRFVLTSDLQAIITDPGDDEVMDLAIKADDVGIPIDGVVPIGDVGRRAYFTTDRGLRSIEYLIQRARSALLHRARAVKVDFACRFERAIALSCRKNARLFDRRLPGGEATGKIVAYRFSANATAGLLIGSVTTASAVGYGGAYTEQAGDPTYVEDGYVGRGYQAYENVATIIGAGDVAYEPPTNLPVDDGWDFTKPVTGHDAVIYFAHIYPANVQERYLREAITSAGPWSDISNKNAARDSMVESAKAALKKWPTTLTYKLKPVEGGPFNTDYDVAVSDLIVPAQIDLEAPPSP